MGKKIKIIVADDNRNFCQMLQNYLQGQEDLSIVGVAYNGLEAMGAYSNPGTRFDHS